MSFLDGLQTALEILHKEEHSWLLIKQEPECLWINHAGEKGTLEMIGGGGGTVTTFGKKRRKISDRECV